MPTVLLVEDESAILEHLRYALERAGYTVLGAISGESAIRICRTYHGAIDVLVSDVLMAPVTGFHVAATVKSLHPNVIVILMSGSPRFMFPDAATHHDFLEKPFCHNELLTAICQHTVTGIRGNERRT
jgi:DNA-binding NtrC family response regulator